MRMQSSRSSNMSSSQSSSRNDCTNEDNDNSKDDKDARAPAVVMAEEPPLAPAAVSVTLPPQNAGPLRSEPIDMPPPVAGRAEIGEGVGAASRTRVVARMRAGWSGVWAVSVRRAGRGAAAGGAGDYVWDVITGGLPEGLRLDALVPEGRTLPGRASNDNFVLTSVEVLAAPADRPEELQPIGLGAAVATHSQDRFPITGVLDPSSASGWAGLGKTGDRSALLVPTRGFGWAEGTELRVKLVFASVHSEHGLARFRLAVRRSDNLEPALRASTWHRAHFPASAAAGLYDKPHPPQEQIAGGVDLSHEAAPGVPWTAHPEYSEGRRHLFESGRGVHVCYLSGFEAEN